MAITGIVGFRCLKYYQGEWHSPAQYFTWDSPVVWAKCSRSYNSCPKDDEGHVIIQRNCDCGIHATLWADEFLNYMHDENHVGFMVEALGNEWRYEGGAEQGTPDQVWASQIWQHTFGFTASGVLVVGVVNWSHYGKKIGIWKDADEEHVSRALTRQVLLVEQASRFFKAPILDYETARMVAKIQWEKGGFTWPFSEEQEQKALIPTW